MADSSNEFEYHLKFPTTHFYDMGHTSDGYDKMIDSKVPVVVLLGWAGCRDKYLSKYSAVYENEG